MNKGNIVYSTDPDFKETCPNCDLLLEDCICQPAKKSDQQRTVYIRREVKGRGGKTVTTISNIGQEAKAVQKELQRLCGAGGTTKQGVIEIQGDHRDKIQSILQNRGYTVKKSGG